LEELRRALRSEENPLAASTVVYVPHLIFSYFILPILSLSLSLTLAPTLTLGCRNYVIKAIINDRTLEWDKERLITLVQDNEWMWKRHQRWILRGPN